MDLDLDISVDIKPADGKVLERSGGRCPPQHPLVVVDGKQAGVDRDAEDGPERARGDHSREREISGHGGRG